jgi:molybdenum cofactor guanylyltransferase
MPMPATNDRIDNWSLIILAGGRGLRAGGIDKGWADWQGTPMIRHLLQRFGRNCPRIIVSANRHLDEYRALGVTVATDLRADFPGPLAGIEAALAATDMPRQVILPCDMPLLPEDLPARLLAALHSEQDISVAHDGSRQQHLCLALSGRYWQTNLSEWLNEGGRSVHGWLQDKPLQRVNCAEQAGAFINLNKLSLDKT